MPRFVLLLHECPGDIPRPTHCDLMLEQGATLETWALAELPAAWRALEIPSGTMKFSSSSTVEVERLADHRLAYLDYEGQVSGDRGTVRRLDAGTYRNGDAPFVYALAGEIIRGEIELRKSADSRWQLVFTGS